MPAHEIEPVRLIQPQWPAPANVHAFSTTRGGGYSLGAWAGLNLADNCGDNSAHVQKNRHLLRQVTTLPGDPVWLRQIHGTTVINAAGESADPGTEPPQADASFSTRPGIVCGILTADCLPVLFCEHHGRKVAAAHAGWRGLAVGVLEQTVLAMQVPAANLLAWLGPAIGPLAYEVGDDVRDNFIAADSRAEAAFSVSVNGRWMADLQALAAARLRHLGISNIHASNSCTYQNPEDFYSYRRDGTCGRMASCIWFQD